MLCALNLCNDVCQLFLSKTRKKYFSPYYIDDKAYLALKLS